MLPWTEKLPITGESIPFAAAAGRCHFSERGYQEEEYLYRGRANVYTGYGEQMEVQHAGVPYTTRLLVRRPADMRTFSGNIVVEILNASARFDIDRMWVFAREYFMRHGDLYIGITSKQDTEDALRAFDARRYADLCWRAPVARNLPDIMPEGVMIPQSAASETGLIWDMLTDLPALIRSGESEAFAGCQEAKIMLTGWSQSAVYLYRYLSDVVPYIKRMGGAEPYDGYFAAGGPHQMSVPINQQGYYQPELNAPNRINRAEVPFMDVQTESEHNWYADIAARLADSDAPGFLYRGYDIAGASHDSVQTLIDYYKEDETAARIGVTPVYRGRHTYANDFPASFVFHALFAAFFAWVREGKAPMHAPRIELDEQLNTVTDEDGNARGGIRTPFIDLPTCSYHNESRVGREHDRLFGHIEVFEAARLRRRYQNLAQYEKLVRAYTDQCTHKGYLLAEDAEQVIALAVDYARRRGL